MKNRIIGFLGMTTLTLGALFVWANWSAPSWTHTLPEHDFRIFRFSAKEVVEPTLEMDGVVAQSWSEHDKVLSVIFDPQQITVKQIENEIRDEVGDFTIVESKYSGSACPIPSGETWISDLKSALCFRSPAENIH